jgi:uncharacterized membrane protein
LLPLGYIVVVTLAALFLHERIRKHHVWGIATIIAGIVIFQLGAL